MNCDSVFYTFIKRQIIEDTALHFQGFKPSKYFLLTFIEIKFKKKLKS